MNSTITYTAISSQQVMDMFFLSKPVETLVPCEPAAAAPATKKSTLPCGQKKKDKKMSRYYDDYEDRYVDSLLQPQTDLERSRDYLRDRVVQIAGDTEYKQFTAFGLRDDETPATPAELVKRIQDGKFVLEDSSKDKQAYNYSQTYITWRDPAVKKDQDGFEATMKSFRKARTQAEDVINTSTPEAGLTAVQALETWAPTIQAS